jgi:hypothetical protein
VKHNGEGCPFFYRENEYIELLQGNKKRARGPFGTSDSKMKDEGCLFDSGKKKEMKDKGCFSESTKKKSIGRCS